MYDTSSLRKTVASTQQGEDVRVHLQYGSLTWIDRHANRDDTHHVPLSFLNGLAHVCGLKFCQVCFAFFDLQCTYRQSWTAQPR